jgi:cell division protein FtsQ
VLRADTDAAEAALEAIPWVQDARVTTDFPHGARVEVRERTAMATYQGDDGSFRVIDPEGRVLEVVDQPPVGLLPVTAETAPDLPPGQFAPTGFRAAASLIEALTPTMESMAQSVQVTADGSDLRLLLAEGIEVRFGASQDLVAKLVRLQTWLDVGRDGAVRTVDVSTDEVTTS